MTRLKPPPRPRRQAYWPVLGLLLAIALLIIAYLLAPSAIQFLRGRLPNFPPPGISGASLNLIFTGILFVLFGLIASLIVAAFVPRAKSNVNDKTMLKEREEMVRGKVARKRRQQEMNRLNKGR